MSLSDTLKAIKSNVEQVKAGTKTPEQAVTEVRKTVIPSKKSTSVNSKPSQTKSYSPVTSGIIGGGTSGVPVPSVSDIFNKPEKLQESVGLTPAPSKPTPSVPSIESSIPKPTPDKPKPKPGYDKIDAKTGIDYGISAIKEPDYMTLTPPTTIKTQEQISDDLVQSRFEQKVQDVTTNIPITPGSNRVNITWETGTGEIKTTSVEKSRINKFQENISQKDKGRIIGISDNQKTFYKAPTISELEKLYEDIYMDVFYPEPEIIETKEEDKQSEYFTPIPLTIKVDLRPGDPGWKPDYVVTPNVIEEKPPTTTGQAQLGTSEEIASLKPAMETIHGIEYPFGEGSNITLSRSKGGIKPIVLPEVGTLFGSVPEYLGFVDKEYKPIINEQKLATLDSGQDLFVGIGTEGDVLEGAGWTPLNKNVIDTKELTESLDDAITSYKSVKTDISNTILDIRKSPRQFWDIDKNADGIYQIGETNLTKQQAVDYYKSLQSNIGFELGELDKRKQAIRMLETKSGTVVYTKETSPIKTYAEDVSKRGGAEGVAWAISGWTPSGLVHDPLGIKSLVLTLRGKPEEAAMTKARILASVKDPELGDILYKEATPIGQAMGKFWGGAAGMITAPVVLPQMGIKYVRGKGDLTDIMGRVETGKTFLPDVGEALYKAGPHGKGQGLISVGMSELITGGKAPSWEYAQEDLWGTFWGTAGEIAGIYALGFGAKGVAKKLPKTWELYSKYRPMSLAKAVPKSIIEGVKRPSFTGALRTGLSKIPKFQSMFEKFTGEPVVITQKWTSGIGKIYHTKLWKPALLTKKALKTPVMKEAISWAELGSKEIMPRSMFGIKPMIRHLETVIKKHPTILNKLRTASKSTITKNLSKVKAEVSRYKTATKNINVESSIDDIVNATKKVYGAKISKEIRNAIDDGLYTKGEIVGLLDDSIKNFENEIVMLEKIAKGESVPLAEKLKFERTATASEKALAWSKDATRPPRLRYILEGKVYRPQQRDFWMEQGQYPRLTQQELSTSFGKGGWHTTVGIPKRYAEIQTLTQALDDALTAGKKPGSISSALKLGNQLDDVAYEAMIKDKNLILTGSRAMKLQSKLSIAKIKRFFGKETDIDLLYKGDYLQTGKAAKEIAEELTLRTGKKHIATTEGVAHEGTWTIKGPGKQGRIMDITSTQSPSKGILSNTYGEIMSIDDYIRTIDGVSVANPSYLVYRQFDIAALQSIIPKKLAEKSALSIKTQTGKAYPDFGVALGESPDTSIMLVRGAKEKLIEKIHPLKYKSDFVPGRGGRWTWENPAQYELFHQSPVAVRWTLGLKGDVGYEPSLFSFSWGAKPRGLFDPTKGIYGKELIESTGIGVSKGPRAAEAYMFNLYNLSQKTKIRGGKPQPTFSFKGADIYRKGGELAKAEAERTYPAFQIKMKTGYTPLTGKFLEVSPSPRIVSQSLPGKVAEAYGETFGKISGWRHYTVDMPTGRTIRYYPTVPQFIKPIGEEIGYFRELKTDVSAQQPVISQPELPKGMFYSERHFYTPEQIGSELLADQARAMTYRQPVGYKALLSRTKTPTKKTYRRKEYKEYEYKIPKYDYRPMELPEYVFKEPTRYEPIRYEPESYGYDYPYGGGDYEPVPRPETQGYPYPYPKTIKSSPPPPPIVLAKEPKKKKHMKKVKRPFDIGYKEKEYIVPFVAEFKSPKELKQKDVFIKQSKEFKMKQPKDIFITSRKDKGTKRKKTNETEPFIKF